ncbi:MAG TPA: LLM class flavin-dependent oxidoreductase [Candidatus Limnocylindrales bacterium]|nr:LLM class flavin-dependent oxidoreductase [Candidatus Limnocylindrales bacterium]
MVSLDLGRIGVWGHLDTLPIDDARAYAARVEKLGYGTLWVPETVGREPFTFLGLLAGSTSRIVLGTSIVGIWGHDAQASRMAALTLAEATGGRFALGLGVSHPHLAGKLRGHLFDRPLSRMRDYLAAYRSAVYKGPMSEGLAEPPVLVAALRDRMTDLAATAADGAFPYLVTARRVAWMRDRLDAATTDRRPILAVTLPSVLGSGAPSDREAARAYLRPYLRTPTYHASWELQGFDPADWEAPGSDRLVDAMVAIGQGVDLRARVEELHAAGADHVAVIPLAPDGTTEHVPVLDALAD